MNTALEAFKAGVNDAPVDNTASAGSTVTVKSGDEVFSTAADQDGNFM